MRERRSRSLVMISSDRRKIKPILGMGYGLTGHLRRSNFPGVSVQAATSYPMAISMEQMTLSSEPRQAPDTDRDVEFRIRENEEQVRWDRLFDNERPVEVEIGCGKGRFLINSAMAHPGINYIGIERALRYFRIMKERVARRELANVRLLRDDAVYFVERFIPDGTVSAYHVYFPDPWPKKRHRKRRLFNARFLEEVVRTLVGGGTLDFATDYVEYYEEILALLETSDRLAVLEEIPERVRELGSDLTNFETKYTAEGRAIHRGAYVKS